MSVLIETITCEPLSVPLVDPFVIASGRVDATRSVLVRARVREGAAAAEGLGEGSCLHPVTLEDQPDALRAVEASRPALEGRTFAPAGADWGALHSLLDACLGGFPVARSGVEMAVLDALARVRRVPLFRLLSGDGAQAAVPVETDITLPILSPARMAELAAGWWAKGFRAFKVKVGKSLEADLQALEAICRAVPEGVLRVDANGGYSADAARRFLDACARLGVRLECFEQPCAPADLAGLAEVARHSPVPVVADESVKRVGDLPPLRVLGAAGGVNLKVAKSGGLLRAYEVGRAARQAGMALMVGGMVETRLGMTAATHLAVALGGVEFPDLDTAWLLREGADPFLGGYREDGPRYTLPLEPGLGITRR